MPKPTDDTAVKALGKTRASIAQLRALEQRLAEKEVRLLDQVVSESREAVEQETAKVAKLTIADIEGFLEQ